METCLARLEALYRNYIETVRELERNRKIGDGLFGLRPGPEDDPCHDRFAAELDALLRDFAAASPGSEDCAAVLRYLFTAPEAWRELKSAYWMLIAVQGLGAGLIERLNAADAGELEALYAARWPRRERLPVQTQILKQLQRRTHTAT